MSQRARRTVAALLSLGLAATGLGLAGTASVAVDAPELDTYVAYSRVADPVLRDTPSLALGSYNYAAVGNLVQLAEGTPRELAEVSFVLANWSCQEGYGDSAAGCTTTDPDATFDVEATLGVFAVDRSGETPVVGEMILDDVRTFAVPYRPSGDPELCTEYPTDHFDEVLGACRPDIKHVVTFDGLDGAMLPDEVIVAIAYDTPSGTPAHTLNVGMDRLDAVALTGSESHTIGWPKSGADPSFWADYNRVQLEVVTTTSFTDVPVDHPFVEQIQWLVGAGLTEGYADGSFQPNASMSRQAMAAFLARWLADGELAACTEAPFTDVPVDHPFCDEIQWMKSEDLSAGYSDGSFRPTATVSRQAGAAFLGQAAGGDRPECTEAPFSDIPAGHPFCVDILWMKDTGITSGYADGTFGPNAPMSRQAMAAWIFAASHLPV